MTNSSVKYIEENWQTSQNVWYRGFVLRRLALRQQRARFIGLWEIFHSDGELMSKEYHAG